MKHMDGYWNLKEIGLVLVQYWGYQAPVRIPRRIDFALPFEDGRTDGRTNGWMDGRDGTRRDRKAGMDD